MKNKIGKGMQLQELLLYILWDKKKMHKALSKIRKAQLIAIFQKHDSPKNAYLGILHIGNTGIQCWERVRISFCDNVTITMLITLMLPQKLENFLGGKGNPGFSPAIL